MDELNVYLCRKGKFGLNCQAVSDVRGRFWIYRLDYQVHLRTALGLREVIFMKGWRAGY